ncbi:hypothetical protein BDV38DRAFT_284575 [Aspergillus pseudotamarii]|uniref:Uncharacterized protein n=1 Tax=Aspergillus pseudotamarii TaxID=132259 RepID=A0A5N6SLX9_ASPPS|nr:uncharacterized protein BDV38DRAFT_284575 [Aspergillus pseudotamarii]KAE8135692.1 hypothetical protein BDV38DRAFT_284575 [Aspergillus pseudotamarii]
MPSTSEKESCKSVVPPSHRQAASPLLGSVVAGLDERFPSTTEILQNHMPMDSNIKDLHETFYSPTGFSNDDVTYLGRFPDYAMLSGVRLPEPQPDFYIHLLLDPNRPIRWPYNQTMGEFIPSIVKPVLSRLVPRLELGKNIDEIHGPVPDYGEKLEPSMNRFFAKMTTDKLIQRGSWGIEIDQPIHIPPGNPIALRHETDQAKFVGAQDYMAYRGDYFLPALELWEREQKEQGIIPEDWQPATLDDHPHYSGWKEPPLNPNRQCGEDPLITISIIEVTELPPLELQTQTVVHYSLVASKAYQRPFESHYPYRSIMLAFDISPPAAGNQCPKKKPWRVKGNIFSQAKDAIYSYPLQVAITAPSAVLTVTVAPHARSASRRGSNVPVSGYDIGS